MSKNKIFGFIAMGSAALLIISMFLPFVSAFSASSSYWKADDGSRVLILLLCLGVAALYVINKKTELAYLVGGFAFFHLITYAIAAEGLDYFAIGYYLMLLSAATMCVMTFLYKEEEGQALLNLNVNVNRDAIKPANDSNK